MKQYLKMADVFDIPVSDEVYRVDFSVISDSNDHVIGGFGIEGMSSHAANAINSHDELVQMNQELLAALEWSDSQIMEFISIAFRHAEIKGDFELSDVRDALKVISSKAKGGAA